MLESVEQYRIYPTARVGRSIQAQLPEMGEYTCIHIENMSLML